MNDIKPVIFLIPLIVLTIVCILYFILLKKSANKKTYKIFILIMIVFAFLLNLAWELLQIPLYKNPVYDIKHIAFCALASIADVLMVLLLYLSLALIFKDPFWIRHLKLKRVLLLVLIGGAGAVLSEMRHLSLGSWGYDDSMPLIPVVNVGISPVLQFMILPLLIYFLSFSCLKIIGRPKNR
jgi:hypothetical protein